MYKLWSMRRPERGECVYTFIAAGPRGQLGPQMARLDMADRARPDKTGRQRFLITDRNDSVLSMTCA